MAITLQRRVRAKPEQRRAQILEQAVNLIGERGYFGFSVEELARRCQMSAPGLLHYFRGKEALLTAVLKDRNRANNESILSIKGVSELKPAGAAPTLEMVQKIFRAIIARNSQQPEFVRLYAVLRAEAMNPQHPAHQFFQDFDARTLEAFAQMLKPHLPKADAAARTVMAVMQGLEHQWLLGGRSFDLVAAWEDAASLLLRTTCPLHI